MTATPAPTITTPVKHSFVKALESMLAGINILGEYFPEVSEPRTEQVAIQKAAVELMVELGKILETGPQIPEELAKRVKIFLTASNEVLVPYLQAATVAASAALVEKAAKVNIAWGERNTMEAIEDALKLDSGAAASKMLYLLNSLRPGGYYFKVNDERVREAQAELDRAASRKQRASAASTAVITRQASARRTAIDAQAKVLETTMPPANRSYKSGNGRTPRAGARRHG